MALVPTLPNGLKPGDTIKNQAGVTMIFLTYAPGIGISKSRDEGLAFDTRNDITKKILGYEKWVKQEPAARCCHKDDKGKRCSELAVGLHDVFEDRSTSSDPLWITVPLCSTHLPWQRPAERTARQKALSARS